MGKKNAPDDNDLPDIEYVEYRTSEEKLHYARQLMKAWLLMADDPQAGHAAVDAAELEADLLFRRRVHLGTMH